MELVDISTKLNNTTAFIIVGPGTTTPTVLGVILVLLASAKVLVELLTIYALMQHRSWTWTDCFFCGSDPKTMTAQEWAWLLNESVLFRSSQIISNHKMMAAVMEGNVKNMAQWTALNSAFTAMMIPYHVGGVITVFPAAVPMVLDVITYFAVVLHVAVMEHEQRPTIILKSKV